MLNRYDKLRARKSVKNFKDKARILRNKGVSKWALPKVEDARYLIKAYQNNPDALHKRLDEIDKFTTKGKVYKTEGGVGLTSEVKKFKNREIARSYKIEELKYKQAQKFGNVSKRKYHENRMKKLSQNIEQASYDDLKGINYAVTPPEIELNLKNNAVDNFMSSIDYGFENFSFINPKIEERMRERLEELTVDELNDLLENDETVRQIMNYYREKDQPQVKFAGESYEDLIEELDRRLPYIVKKYKQAR